MSTSTKERDASRRLASVEQSRRRALLTTVGLRQTMKSAHDFGFDDLPAVPSVALGSGEVTLSAITAAYGAFANNGAVFHPHLDTARRRSRRPGAVRESQRRSRRFVRSPRI